MAIDKELFGPKNAIEEEVHAIESLVFSVQISLQRAMTKKGISNKELAEKLGMTPARVSQIFATKGANLTLKTIAKIQHALGEEFEFVNKRELKSIETVIDLGNVTPFVRQANKSVWRQQNVGNINRKVKMAVAS